MIRPLGQATGEFRDIREWVTLGQSLNVPNVSTTQIYTGIRSIGLANGQCKSPGVVFAAKDFLRLGYWFRHGGVYNQNTYSKGTLFTLTSALTQVEIGIKGIQNVVYVAIDGVAKILLDVNGHGILTPDVWKHCGLTYQGGVGGGLTLWYDSLPVLTYMSDDLPGNIDGAYAAGGPIWPSGGNVSTLVVGSSIGDSTYGWATSYLDDFYVDGSDDSVDVSLAEMPPPDRFLAGAVNGAGVSTQWTPTGQTSNYACVDDIPPNDDTDYVLANAADKLDLYTKIAVTLPENHSVVSASVVVLVKRLAAGPTLKIVAHDGISVSLESAEETPGTSYAYKVMQLPAPPDLGEWSIEKFNSMQVGIKSTGNYA